MVGKIYFASDMHLGYPNPKESQWREQLFVSWLDSISADADELYLVGDMFDFWYEYKRVIPKGFVRTLGKLAQMVDNGIKVHFFTGNHDVWAFSYLHDEIGIILHDEPFETVLLGKRFYIAHGDGLGPGDLSYKFLKSVFRSRFVQFLFSTFLHPDIALWFGHKWSNSSRGKKGLAPLEYQGDDKEQICLHAMSLAKANKFDYLVFGHRHLVVDKQLSSRARMVILGDWIYNFSYGVFDGRKFEMFINVDKNDVLQNIQKNINLAAKL